MSATTTKVLLADDEDDIRVTLGKRLRTRGYEVEIAVDGLEALDKVRSFGPDLLILDVMMPELNGFQVCRTLREDPGTRDLPVLMLTAKAQESDRFWGGEVGATRYITKPFSNQDLLDTVVQMLECASHTRNKGEEENA
jgi:DNA-binding response OmpR family regulator